MLVLQQFYGFVNMKVQFTGLLDMSSYSTLLCHSRAPLHKTMVSLQLKVLGKSVGGKNAKVLSYEVKW